MDGFTDRRIGDLMIAAKVISETPWSKKIKISFSQNIWRFPKMGVSLNHPF
jgi:hypothetical protein